MLCLSKHLPLTVLRPHAGLFGVMIAFPIGSGTQFDSANFDHTMPFNATGGMDSNVVAYLPCSGLNWPSVADCAVSHQKAEALVVAKAYPKSLCNYALLHKQLVVLGLGWQETRHVIVFRTEPTSNCHSEERSDEESRIGSFSRFLAALGIVNVR